MRIRSTRHRQRAAPVFEAIVCLVFDWGAIENEANNGLKNRRGSLAMARTSDPHSATSQFFINHVDNEFLNFTSESMQGWGYAVFGKVTEGMDVVDEIAKVATDNKGGHQNVPIDTITITGASRQ